jgi:hypothetical protein
MSKNPTTSSDSHLGPAVLPALLGLSFVELDPEVEFEVEVALSVSITKNVPPIEGPRPARERKAVSYNNLLLRRTLNKVHKDTHIETCASRSIEAETCEALGVQSRWLCIEKIHIAVGANAWRWSWRCIFVRGC